MLFSDIEGSTRLLQQLGNDYADVLMQHHALLRRAFTAHAGEEQSTEGDSFFVTFPAASDAVAAAVDAQVALATHPWPHGSRVRVRMGIHVGEIQTVGGTIVGMAVHEAARIGAAAHGGQVLVSERAAELSQRDSWRDLGAHTLKDIAEPMRLLQLTHPGLTAEFPPPRSQGPTPDNLPPQPSTFVGRAAEVAEVRRLLFTTRVLTLTGAGGAGKSRLALRVAADEGLHFPDGVFFVDLAPISDPNGVTAQVFAAVGLPEDATGDLTGALGARTVLLVIDNCEHVLGAVAELVDDIVRYCPGARVLATSREPVGVDGELAWRVPSLNDDEAIELFVARAGAVNPDFELSDDNRATVADICRRLDAIPLALELAGARMSSLGLNQLAARLDQRFRLLAGGSRSTMARQRTLQAAVDWSYDLLEPAAQEVLRRLGVFVGGIALEAAEFVCAMEGIDALDVDDHLDQLVSKSLVVAEHHDGHVRYRLLETIRQYALDRLIQADEVEVARNAHAAWILSLAAECESQLWDGGPHEVETMARLDAETGNIRAAFEWLSEGGHLHEAVQLARQLFPWQLTKAPTEGVRETRRLRDQHLSAGDRAIVAFEEFLFRSNAGGYESAAQLRAFARDFEGLGASDAPWLVPAANAYLADTEAWLGLRPVAEAVEIAEREAARADRPLVAGMTLHALSSTRLMNGDLDGARAASHASWDAIRDRGLSFGESRSARFTAQLAVRAGDLDEAWRHAEVGLAAARRTGDTGMIVASTLELAVVLAIQDDLAGAVDLIVPVLDLANETLAHLETAQVYAIVAWYALLAGDVAAAYAFSARAVELHSVFDAHMVAAESALVKGDPAAARPHIAPMRDVTDPALPDLTRPIALLMLSARLRFAEGDATGAARLLGAAAAHPTGAAVLPAEQRRLDDLIEQCRAALGGAFDEAWSAGAALDLAGALAEV
jgi:predicted ATPase